MRSRSVRLKPRPFKPAAKAGRPVAILNATAEAIA